MIFCKKLIICSLASLLVMPAYALNKNSTKQIVVNINGEQALGSEAEMYKAVYDMKYNSYMELMVKALDDIGIEPLYFMDDVRKHNECYAAAFAKDLSVSDFEILMSTQTSKTLRDNIIDNIANKEMDKCRNKYQPYLNGGFETIISEYVSRKCGKNKPKTEKEIQAQMECVTSSLHLIMQKADAKD